MMNQNHNNQPFYVAGTITTALRLVIGWTYFSAFWRRLILENKLDPETAGYIGEKFNHFLPNALGIKPVIEHLVSNPDQLWWAMAIFTIVEAIVGLFIIFGLFTRLMSIGVIFLAMGILLGSGWLGTTCLDEWQIGVLGVAGGFTLLLAGGGRFSLDNCLKSKDFKLANSKVFTYFASGELKLNNNFFKLSAIGAGVILFITLFTNQYFHGGVWGDLHNKSVKPKVEISNASINGNSLSFTVFRVEGADVYGSFLIDVSILDSSGSKVFNFDGEQLSQIKKEYISNDYVAKVKPGKHSLVLPLGAKAKLSFNDSIFDKLPSGAYKLLLTDISGITWYEEIVVN